MISNRLTVADVPVAGIFSDKTAKRSCYLTHIFSTLRNFFGRIAALKARAMESNDAALSTREELSLKYGYNLRWFF